MKYTILIHGIPAAQQRPRFFRRGSKVGAYDPQRSKSWKEIVRWSAVEAGVPILPGPLKVTLFFLLPRPKSLPKKVTEHTRKPDLDNLIKSVLDALKGIAFKDDAQIVSLRATKAYTIKVFGVEVNLEAAES